MARSGTDNKLKNQAEGHKDARLRLLGAAEQLFAEHGVDGTSIRDLTTAAQSNLASVHYHFGSKEHLYTELFRSHLAEMRETRLGSIDAAMNRPEGAELTDLLRAFSIAFLKPFADPEASRRFMKLFAREIFEQRLPKAMFVNELVGPTLDALGSALKKLCPYLDEQAAQHCIISLISQLVHIIHAKGILGGHDGLDLPALDIPQAVEHIVKFSAAGIGSYQK